MAKFWQKRKSIIRRTFLNEILISFECTVDSEWNNFIVSCLVVELFHFAKTTNNSESVSTEVKVRDNEKSHQSGAFATIERDYRLTVWEQTHSTPSKSFTWWNSHLGINSSWNCCHLATYYTCKSETWEQFAKNHLS